MYLTPSAVASYSAGLQEDNEKTGCLNPRSPVTQIAFQKLLKISVKTLTGVICPRIRSFGELSELENQGIEDCENSSIDDEECPLEITSSSQLLPNGGTQSLLEMTMLALWESCHEKKLFRYDVTACSTKTLTGNYGFVAQLNEGRASKKRPTEFRLDHVLQSFDEGKFHFGKACLQEVLFQFDTTAPFESILEEDACTGRSPDLVMINVSPIEYGHILLIPKVLDRLTQIISSDTIQLALQFTAAVDNPYFRLGYNSLGAYATINHLHFQGYYLMAPYPVERAVTEELSGIDEMEGEIRVSKLVGYPVRGWVFEMKAAFDDCLVPMCSKIGRVCVHLQTANIPHNLLISDCGARVFLFPQCFAKKQAAGVVPESILATGVNPACFEIAGHVILKNKEDYEGFTQKEVWSLLSEVSLEDSEFDQLTLDCFKKGGSV